MRHLYGIALGVGMTLVMFFGGAWGYLQLLRLPVLPGQASALPADGGSLLSDHTALLAFGALLGTAVLAGLLAVAPWVSPLASGLPGLLLLAWTGLFLVRVQQAVSLIPLRSHSFGAGWEALLFNGVLGAAGVAMTFPLFFPSRWRTRPFSSRWRTRSAQVSAGGVQRDADDHLAALSAENTVPAAESAAATAAQQSKPERTAAEQETRADEPPLVGTVLPRRADWPADAMRITGANQALRNTGSFGAVSPNGKRQGPSGGGLLGEPYRGD